MSTTTNGPEAGDIVATIADIFERRGVEAYLGEAVTMAEHMLQAATFARAADAPDALVAAALLHDIGHFTSEFGAWSAGDMIDMCHEDAGATILAGHFMPRITETVRLHVAAKRYLCAVEPGYRDTLSDASKRSLVLQGGPMNATEVAAFQQNPFNGDAVRVRQWDDAGKVVGMQTMNFDEFRPLLTRLVLEAG